MEKLKTHFFLDFLDDFLDFLDIFSFTERLRQVDFGLGPALREVEFLALLQELWEASCVNVLENPISGYEF